MTVGCVSGYLMVGLLLFNFWLVDGYCGFCFDVDLFYVFYVCFVLLIEILGVCLSMCLLCKVVVLLHAWFCLGVCFAGCWLVWQLVLFVF